MAQSARRQLPSIVASIVDNAPQYQFLQALRLLEDVWGQQLSLKPAPNISFPSADIRSATLDQHDQLSLYLSFMGLCGVDSPLPQYMIDACVIDSENGEVLREFLAIFNQRLYRLLYLVWQKYQANLQCEKKQSPYEKYVQALSGMLLQQQDGREFSYAGLLGARVHNASSLAELITDYLTGVHVSVESFVPRWLSLTERVQLNGHGQLGDNAVLGDRVIDLSSKIIINIGPLSQQAAKLILPGQVQARKLAQLIMRYLGPTMVFDVALNIVVDNGEMQCLGGGEISLGWASWLGRLQDQCLTIRFTGAALLA